MDGYRVKHNFSYQQFAIIKKLSFHNLNFNKNFVKYCCKKFCWSFKNWKKNRNTTASDFLESVLFSDNSKKIYPERFENRLLECQSFLNQNKQLISKLDDSTRKISSLEISVLQKRWKEVKLSSSKLNGKEEQLTKLNVRNFNMDGMGKFQNENFKKENK